jgi:hypothetical protein
LETLVRTYNVGPVQPRAQYPCTVSVECTEPGKRRRFFYTMEPTSDRYLTIEVGGRVVYDSRADVPCDMEEWAKIAAQFAKNREIDQVIARRMAAAGGDR